MFRNFTSLKFPISEIREILEVKSVFHEISVREMAERIELNLFSSIIVELPTFCERIIDRFVFIGAQ